MGASSNTLKEIVRRGANLTLTRSVGEELLRELVNLSLKSGSQLSIPTTIGDEVILELAATGTKQITFVDF